MLSSIFTPHRISKSARVTLQAPLTETFPLFNPIGERDWADGWNPQILYPLPERVEEHMVFKTHPHHGHGEPDYVWTVSSYLPEQGSIEYTIFAPERMWRISIRCTQGDDHQTTVAEITYTYIGLTELGNAINEKAAQIMFMHDLKDWEEAINYYLKTGQKLEHHP